MRRRSLTKICRDVQGVQNAKSTDDFVTTHALCLLTIDVATRNALTHNFGDGSRAAPQVQPVLLQLERSLPVQHHHSLKN
eukprot:1153702-Pelagomonas_calceolata.AAC.11